MERKTFYLVKTYDGYDNCESIQGIFLDKEAAIECAQIYVNPYIEEIYVSTDCEDPLPF